MSKSRYFRLRDRGKEVAILTAMQPRQAALKAATMGFSHIELRERGTKKVHVYEGKRVKVPAPKDLPWNAKEVWKPRVKKVKIYFIDRIRKRS